ncbi:MAG: thioredoxin fold domain-containing protein [Herbaspirillum sp.]
MKSGLISLGFTAFLGLQGAVCAAPITLAAPSDLSLDVQQSQQKNQPLVVFFSLPDCSYCEEVRQNYLTPLIRDVPPSDQVLIREVSMVSNAPLKGFKGESLTQAQLAKQYKIKVAPTVLMLGKDGVLLAKPLVGAGMAGFYGAYLDNAFEAAHRTLQQGSSQPAAGSK